MEAKNEGANWYLHMNANAIANANVLYIINADVKYKVSGEENMVRNLLLLEPKNRAAEHYETFGTLANHAWIEYTMRT